MFNLTVTSDWLLLIAGGALSLIFSYFPGLNTWYAGLSDAVKKLVMMGLIALIAGAVMALTCYGVIESNLVCTKEGIVQVIGMYLLTVGVNQGVFKITPTVKAVAEIKLVTANAEEKVLLKSAKDNES